MTKHAEFFAALAEFPGYRFGSMGTVESRWIRGSKNSRLGENWREVKARENKIRKYLYVTLKTPEGRKHMRVNVLILWAFTGSRPEGLEATHKDGNRLDNRLDNLEWKTHASNIADKFEHGTMVMGEQVWNAKLKEFQIPEIKALASNGNSSRFIASQYGVSDTLIRKILKGERWCHVGGAS